MATNHCYLQHRSGGYEIQNEWLWCLQWSLDTPYMRESSTRRSGIRIFPTRTRACSIDLVVRVSGCVRHSLYLRPVIGILSMKLHESSRSFHYNRVGLEFTRLNYCVIMFLPRAGRLVFDYEWRKQEQEKCAQRWRGELKNAMLTARTRDEIRILS